MRALWRWRDGVSIAVAAQRGGKVSEDIAVPLDRLREAIEATVAIGERHGLEACSWGHAGDGNLHSTFLVDPPRTPSSSTAPAAASGRALRADGPPRRPARQASTGSAGCATHVVGASVAPPRAIELHRQVKRLFDPKNLLNPGKKVAR